MRIFCLVETVLLDCKTLDIMCIKLESTGQYILFLFINSILVM